MSAVLSGCFAAQAAGALPDGHLFEEDLLGLDGLSAAATAWRYPSPGGWLAAMPDPGDVEAALADIEAFLPEIRDWLAEH